MKLRLLLISILVILLTAGARAQISSLYQTPSLGLNLPNFNPAFAGDMGKNRLYTINTSIRPKDRSLLNNYSAILGYDGKYNPTKSGVVLTYGVTWNHNVVQLQLSELNASVLNPMPEGQVNLQYGTAEVIFGGRLPIGGERRRRKSAAGNKQDIGKRNGNIGEDEGRDVDPNKQGRRNKKQFRKRIKLEPETATFLAPIDDSWVCGNNSSLDYLAMNVSLNYNYADLVNASGLIFGNQITSNQIGTATPFGLSNSVNDPVIGSNDGLFSSTNIDMAIGVLFHKVLSSRSVMRIGYSYRNLFRGFGGVHQSAQRNIPVQVLQLNLKKRFRWMGEWSLNVLYLQQSEEWVDVPLSQSRVELFKKFELNKYGRPYGKTGWRLQNFEPGIATYFNVKKGFQDDGNNEFEERNRLSMPLFSLFVGSHLQKHSNGKTRSISQGGTKKQITDYHLFFSWDFHVSPNLHFRETSGNARVGLVVTF